MCLLVVRVCCVCGLLVVPYWFVILLIVLFIAFLVVWFRIFIAVWVYNVHGGSFLCFTVCVGGVGLIVCLVLQLWD